MIMIHRMISQEIGSTMLHKNAKEKLRTASRPTELIVERIDDDRMRVEEIRTTNQVALHLWRLRIFRGEMSMAAAKNSNEAQHIFDLGCEVRESIF